MPLPTLFANATSATGAQLDADLAVLAQLTIIPCAVSGTNALVLTPGPGVPSIPAYYDYSVYSGIAVLDNTGAVTAQVGGLAVRPVYKDGGAGPVALTGAEIQAGNYFQLIFDAALNGATGGFHLVTGGATAAGTVTSIIAGTGLAGGTITSAGTLSLATIATARIMANISGGNAAPSANTLTGVFDNIFGTSQGYLLYRSGSAWVPLLPGTSGQFLQTQGAAANPQWATGVTYATGTWTPTLVGTGTAGAPTYTLQNGSYTKLGNLVIAWFTIITSALGAPTGDLTIGGLPFQAGATANDNGRAVVNAMNGVTLTANYTVLAGAIPPSAQAITLIQTGSTVNTTTTAVGIYAAATTLGGVAIYHTA